MAINELLPFAVAPSANVMTQAEYAALTARAGGFVSGVAQSEQLNKVWRQAAFVAAMIGQYTANNSDEDVLDNGDVDTFEQNFALAVAATAVSSLPFATAAEVLAATLANKVVSPKTIAPAVQSGKWNYSVAGGTANALTVTLDPALTANVAGTPLRIMLTAPNDPGATLNAGPGALPIRRMDGQPVARGDLPAGVPVTLLCSGGAWVLVGVAYSEIPRQVTSNLTFYVRPDGSDGNDGSADTSAKAFATPQGAVNYIARTFATGSNIATINVAAGTYPGVNIVWTPLPLKFMGTGANRTAVFNQTGTSLSAAILVRQGYVTVENIQINNGSASFCVWAFGSGANLTLISCGYGNSLNASIASTFGGVVMLYGGAHAINNSTDKPRCFFAETGGTIACDTDALVNFAVTGNPGFNGQFIYVSGGSVAAMVNARFAGSARGYRYTVSRSSNLHTSGGGANFFPGDAPGTADSATFGSYS